MPLEIVALQRQDMTIQWDDGHESRWPARELRLRCRCANCVEEMTGEPLLDPARVPEDVRVSGVEVVGQYALSIHFSDEHTTGIFTFRDLRADCPCDTCAAQRAKRP